MKTKFLLLVAFAWLYIAHSHAQTIRRVNNTPGVTGPNIYATVQAAHDAAAVGDIIYLEPSSTNSPNNLGPLVCTKRLTIIGTGYLLSANAGEPGMPADKREAWITTAQFNNGSAGSVVVGVVFLLPSGGAVNVKDGNIKFERCYMPKIILGAQLSGSTILCSSNNTRIVGCYIPWDGGWDPPILGQSWVVNGITFFPSNCQIENNILTSGMNGVNNSLINNNVVTGAGITTFGSIVKNNIFFSATNAGSGNTYFNNISTSNNLPAGNGNVNNANSSLLFITTNRTHDKHYQLGSSSAAIGAGENGTDCGPFGGATPYILSGLPPYPVITDLQVSGTGSTTVPLNVTISAKSNN